MSRYLAVLRVFSLILIMFAGTMTVPVIVAWIHRDGVGSTSVLTFTLTNPNTSALTGVNFTDVLPGGLTIHTTPGVTNTCGGVVTAAANTQTISLAGGTINGPANTTCTISVTVRGVSAGTHTNTSTNIASTETGPNTSTTPNVGFGQASITVIAPPVINKSFTANPIFTGETTLLTFSINNPNASTAMTNLAFTDNLPAGLVVDTTTTSPETIRKALNPKGLGLLVSGTVRRGRTTGGERYVETARALAELLLTLRAPGHSGAAWGYPFPWQSRAFFLPRGTPTIVNTAFVAHAMLDVARYLGEERYASVARSTCTFVLKDLARTEEEGALCFSYTPLDRLAVHNANLLGAGLLARVGAATGEAELLDTARRAARWTLRRQQPSGAWWYAEAPYQRWVDSFHTGFVLEALRHVILGAGLDEPAPRPD